MAISLKFDGRALKGLTEIMKMANIDSPAETVRQALCLVQSIQKQVKRGYTLIRVYNPSTDSYREFEMSDLFRHIERD